MKGQERDPILKSGDIECFKRAVTGGGLPIVDKDEVPDLVHRYHNVLTENGVKGKSLRRQLGNVEKAIYGGSPTQASIAFNRIDNIVSGK